VASEAYEFDPVVVLIPDPAPATMTFDEWLALVGKNEPVDIDISAVQLLAEVREHDEA
jgi:hypothetical protein